MCDIMDTLRKLRSEFTRYVHLFWRCTFRLDAANLARAVSIKILSTSSSSDTPMPDVGER